MMIRRPAILLLLLSLFALPSLALAHVHLEKSFPAKDEALEAAPTTVQLWFSGKIEADWSKIEVTDASGNRVDQGDVAIIGGDSKGIQINLTPLSAGSYTVKWNAVAGDSHRIKGSLVFRVK